MRPIGAQTVTRMRDLLLVWRNTALPPVVRHIRLHALLLEVIVDILPDESRDHIAEEETRLWWQIETALRNDLSEPVSLARLVRFCHRSERSVFRACKKATGLAPMQRVRQMRLSHARGLLQLSSLSISEIAYAVGHGRVQEFSRDFRKQYGGTPTDARRAGPDYRQRQRTTRLATRAASPGPCARSGCGA